ncbi:hydrolase [Parasphingorhabdus cellanae]|uniref:Hydrolase n=1 Tax=Parasphingorhabdus cellanae TaxID=2806553 RepID=A0ABX7T2X0_9SPHN|nr:hydrolase [Parasphingorhabdus cellanae]QTD55899.1 hydrolase [Parasphingorhabdus cellanae]
MKKAPKVQHTWPPVNQCENWHKLCCVFLVLAGFADAFGFIRSKGEIVTVSWVNEKEQEDMKENVTAGEIDTLLDDADDNIEILSLDCFDTLIWRNVNRPIDIFHDLDITDCTMELRVLAEKRARKALVLDKAKNEVTIHEIYEKMFREADQARVANCVEKELLAETRHCFAFAPVSMLIDRAKSRGLKVIIVSDTYLPETLLRRLITDAAGPEIADKIDRIFCSCDYGMSKAGGLFKPVLADLGVSPGKILHLGDNKKADFDAPMKLGINGVHFEQFDDEASERLRLEAVAATILDKDTRKIAPSLQPHRAQISLRSKDEATFQFGHDVLGPILHGFSRWIAEEFEKIEIGIGKKPKLLFLLRDGYLPAKAFLEVYPEYADHVAMVELSRFTSSAASFVDRKAIETFLMAEATGNKKDAYSQQRQAAYCRQLLFSKDEIPRIAGMKTPTAFIREVLKTKNVKKIVTRSKKFRAGLIAHLKSNGVEQGETVVFVDLGYNGSVQNVIEPVLRAEMDLDISGRYLLLRELMITDLDKKGLIDVRHYDNSALNALCESIAVLEQLCTQSNGSVLGYSVAGEPERDTADIKGKQSDERDNAQVACLTYIKQLSRGWATTPKSWDGDCARHMAAASLSRLLFLPVEREIGIFENFHHDVNLGTKDMLKFIDADTAQQGMRRRGVFYTKNISRIYLPGELKQQGMQALLPLFAGNRFALDLRQNDFQSGGIKIPVMLADDKEHLQIEVDAHPTSDGYYQALIPAGTGQFNIAIMLGQICDWLQIEEVNFHDIDNFMAKKIDDDAITAHPVYEAMTENAPGLHRCTRQDAFMFVPPPAIATSETLMLNFVFRPTVLSKAAKTATRKVA